MTEEALLFGRGNTLAGILTRPAEDGPACRRPGVVIVNAGLVHRVGPNRLGVKLARRLAELGHFALRFDLSGIGDSEQRTDGLPFHKSALAETVEAMDQLSGHTGVRKFILTGICTGASVSFGTALVDSRVAGAALINLRALQLGSEDLVAWRALHIAEARRVLGPGLPLDLATRAVGVRKAIRVALDLVRDLPRQKEIAEEAGRLRQKIRLLADRRAPLLFVCSPWDGALYYHRLLLGGETSADAWGGMVTTGIIPASDHTFSTLAAQQRLLKVLGDWLGRCGW
jgi:hypothetical protein